MFRKLLDSGEAGDNVGLLLRGIDKDKISLFPIQSNRLKHTPEGKPYRKVKVEVFAQSLNEALSHEPCLGAFGLVG